MAEYIVHLKTSAFTNVKVEADTVSEAIDKAVDAEMPTLCAHCSGWNEWDPPLELNEEWEVDIVTAPDGTATDV